jgi:hypothetical protein
MTLESQCCNLIQAKRLKELGVIGPSLFYHIYNTVPTIGYEGIKLREDLNQKKRWGNPVDGGVIRYYAAYTVAELGVMLPRNYASKLNQANQGVCFAQWEKGEVANRYGLTEAECRANMLIYLLESNLANPSEVNNRLNS